MGTNPTTDPVITAVLEMRSIGLKHSDIRWDVVREQYDRSKSIRDFGYAIKSAAMKFLRITPASSGQNDDV